MKLKNTGKWKRRLALMAFVAAFCLGLPFAASAEGSKDLCENGGYRPYTERYGLETAGEERDEIISVYLKAGETVSFGSSVCNAVLGYTNEKLGTHFSDAELAALNATDILVTTPAWDSTANPHSYPYVGGAKDDAVLLFNIDDHATETSQGYIANAAREAAGPGAAAGYTPYTLTAATSGIYRFKFYSAKHNIENPTPVVTTGVWNQKGSCVAAWDTTVRDAAGRVIEGRTFTSTLFLNMGNNVANKDVLKSCIYAVTDDGYRYKVDFNGMDPYGFVFYANNRGMLQAEVDGASYSLYHSVMSNNNQLSDLAAHDIVLNNIPADAADHTYHLFYNEPDAAALAALGIGDPDAGGSVTGFTFTGKGDATADEGFLGLGGTFSFTAGSDVKATSYQIELNFGPDNTVLLSNHLQTGLNSIPWDGRDAKGNIVPAGTYGSSNVTLKLKGGEVHFPLMDVENNRGGIKISRLNGLSPDNVVYYNNSGSSNIGDTTAPWTAAKNWNVADKLDVSATGVDSTTGAMAYSNRAGDQCALDLWAYYGTTADLTGFELKIVDTKFIATKVWAGEPADWAHRPADITLQLYADGIATGDPVSVTAADGWSHTFEGLSPADANGHQIGYTVRETAVPPYYTATYEAVTGDVTAGFAQQITNTATLTSVKVRKVWDNEDDPAKPTSVVVQLYADEVAEGTPVTITGADEWKHTFSGLDPAKKYSVQEDLIPDYTGKVSAMQGSAELGYTCTITNTYDLSTLTTVGVMKEWQKVPAGLRPDEVTMTLLRSADGVSGWEPARATDDTEIAPEHLNEANDWLHVWNKLPNGFTYAVAETLGTGIKPEDAGYTLTDSDGTAIADSGLIPLHQLGATKYYYLDVVNTYKPTSFAFTKNWHHGINTNPETQPGSITVQLQQRVADADFADYGPAVTLAAAQNWQYSWSDLPSYNKDSARYEYRVTEKALSTYRADPGAVEGSAVAGYTQQITNSYKYTMLTITKSWDHGAQPEADYPTGVRCKLVAPDGKTVTTFMLTEANEWKCELHDLPCLDADGNAIDYTKYTVVEGDVINYEHSGGTVTVDADAGYQATLANTYVPVPTLVPPPAPTKNPPDDPTPTAAPASTSTPTPTPTVTATPVPVLTGAHTIPATGAGDSPALCAGLAAVSGLALVLLALKKHRENR